jgi:hypothetical protein
MEMKGRLSVTLREAYELAEENDGAPGIDGVTLTKPIAWDEMQEENLTVDECDEFWRRTTASLRT